MAKIIITKHELTKNKKQNSKKFKKFKKKKIIDQHVTPR